MKLTKLLFILVLLSPISLLAQVTEEFGAIPEPDYYFGFNMIPRSDGSLVHLALVKPLDNGRFDVKFITRQQFYAQIAGQEESKANTKGVNFFREYDIPDSTAIDNLWRLRYQDNPFRNADGTPKQNDDPGWAGKPRLPTPDQWKVLNTFGIERPVDYCYGEDFFRLLKSMNDCNWIASYVELGMDGN